MPLLSSNLPVKLFSLIMILQMEWCGIEMSQKLKKIVKNFTKENDTQEGVYDNVH